MEHPWKQPESRDVGALTDPTLYGETLLIARSEGRVSAAQLRRELGPRLRGQFLIQQQQSERVARQLILENLRFGWLSPDPGSRSRAAATCRLTETGAAALALFQAGGRPFLRCLVERMQAAYTIPGWLVDRLWRVNPAGQGEVILPAPPSQWKPESRYWDDSSWTDELESQARLAAAHARLASPGAFPVADSLWLAEVRHDWGQLCDRPARARTQNHDPPRYSPRQRLARAMRQASLRLLFDRVPPGSSEADYAGSKSPFYPRSFVIWCARLLALELLFYTDWHPSVEGRLLFPVGVFRENSTVGRFEALTGIARPDGHPLYLHQPEWSSCRERFWQSLVDVHRPISQRVRSRYVSLLDVRDEVCRQLRLSAARFEEFLERALNESPPANCPWYISAETDLREDLRSGAGLLRRPVYVRRVPHTLIALTRLGAAERNRT